jgi:hypothetical protein
MTRRIVTVLVAVLALGLVAAGCGDDDESDAGRSTPAAAEDVSSDPAPSPAQLGAKKAEALRKEGYRWPATPRDRLVEGVEVEEGSDEEQVLELIDGFFANINGGNATEFCARLSRDAHRQIAAVRGTAEGVACEQAFPSILRTVIRGGLRKTLETRIHGIEISGDEGVLTLKSGGKVREVPVVKEPGGWKLDFPG